jgi:lysophospholipase L1-like esterase
MSRIPVLCALAMVTALVLPSAAGAAAKSQYYVSLGDSYATGYQPTSKRGGTRNGFAYQLPGLAAKRGYQLKLVNFGCGGATSTSILMQELTSDAACKGPGSPRYTGTQARAAEQFLRANRGRIGLITVSIGGNDIMACARAADPVSCVGTALPKVETNLAALLKRLRAAGGSKVRIVGITYPDVLLGSWVGENADQDLAKLSVVAFKSLINPALKETYEGADGTFVDVTKATGAYTPLEQTTDAPPYGSVPVAVAEVCRLSFYCSVRDIHATTAGYRIIADLVAKTLPRRG